MKNQNMPPTGGPKHGNDPRKNDPTRQDERDNDATRIRPEKENQQPSEPPIDPSRGPSTKGIEEPAKGEPYKRTPEENKQKQVEEPDKKNSAVKGHNPAEPKNHSNDSAEKDDSGNPVM